MLNHSMEQDFSQGAEQQQQPAPLQEEELPPALGPRSDTITSSTAYFSMAEVQPRNTHRYTGLSLQDGENNQLQPEEISLEPGLGAGVKPVGSFLAIYQGKFCFLQILQKKNGFWSDPPGTKSQVLQY